MEQVLVAKEKRKTRWCCFRKQSSDEESVITIDKQSFANVEPEVQRCSSNYYAADKVYLIGTKKMKYAVTFKHVLIAPKNSSSSRFSAYQSNIGSSKSSMLTYTEKSLEIKPLEPLTQILLSEKMSKKLCKLIHKRIKVSNCLISMNSPSALTLKMASYCNVIAVEHEEVIVELLKLKSDQPDMVHKINLIEGSICNIAEGIEADLIILAVQNESSNNDLDASSDFPQLLENIEKCLQITENLVIIFPCNVNPKSVCEALDDLAIDPCIEFFLFFEASVLKHLIVFIGKVSRIKLPDVINSILSRLGLNFKQKLAIKQIIEKLSLRKTFEILNEVERNIVKESVIEQLETRAKMFFDLARQEDCSICEVLMFYRGPKGAHISRILKQMKEFYFEFPTDGESFAVYNGQEIRGEANVLNFIESLRADERALSNSLLQLIEP